jgi:hypothetical protein
VKERKGEGKKRGVDGWGGGMQEGAHSLFDTQKHTNSAYSDCFPFMILLVAEYQSDLDDRQVKRDDVPCRSQTLKSCSKFSKGKGVVKTIFLDIPSTREYTSFPYLAALHKENFL